MYYIITIFSCAGSQCMPRLIKIAKFSFALGTTYGIAQWAYAENLFENNLFKWTDKTFFTPEGFVCPNEMKQNNSSSKNYFVYPHQHYKIWFSENPDEFLPKINQNRLEQFRETNPNDSMTLVYSAQMLSLQTLIKLYCFCFVNKIIPRNFDTLPVQNLTEGLLKECARDEIKYRHNGGCLAAASDITRLLGYTNKFGIYCDFDAVINTQNLPLKISINAPYLFNIKSIPRYNGIWFWLNYIDPSPYIEINNDIAYIADPNELDDIQEEIIERYEITQSNLKRCWPNRTSKLSLPETNKQLFAFRKLLKESIAHGHSQSKQSYIDSVIHVSGPGMVWDKVVKPNEASDNFIKYSFFCHPELANAFKPNATQDLSWVPQALKKH